jgi:alkanesulfonate monooxygenase SsuD/methylene tetrahydromethanopterin reductase-like flavin-dependent oxidoreductase (luciferase family)
MTEPTGLLAFWKNYDRKLYLRAVQLADDLGYDSFWVPEAWGYDIFSLVTEMAVKTKRIKLGTAIVNAFSRSPGVLAMSTATIDEISEGRFILGIGTSGKNVIEGFHGRKFEKPLTQVRDVIRVVRTLLAGGKLSDAGAELADYRPFKLEMKPARADVPIYVAALKPKAIESIGELADGWIPTFWPYEKLAEGRAWIAEGAKKAGARSLEDRHRPLHHRAASGPRGARDDGQEDHQLLHRRHGRLLHRAAQPLRLRRRLQEDRRSLPGQGHSRPRPPPPSPTR